MKHVIWAWHVHHAVLVEPLVEPISVRRKFIRENKPEVEVALRLRLLKVVKGKLPEALTKVYAVQAKARAAQEKAYAVQAKARAVQAKAYAAWETADAAWGTADAAWETAYAAWAKANAAWETAYAAWAKANAARETAYREYLPEIEALHKIECPDCPWDGKTIFPKKEEIIQ